MKILKYTLCIALMISAIAFAGKRVLGPTSEGLIFLVKDPGVQLEEYVVTNGATPDLIKDWVILKGGGPKTKIIIDGKNGAGPEDANILVETAKMVKGKKTVGSIDNLLFGVFTPSEGQMDKSEIGDMTRFEPNTGIKIKLKGVAVGTVIAKNNKMVLVDSLVKFATDEGFKGKGAKVATKRGQIGGTEDEQGWLGIPTWWPSIATIDDLSEGCWIKKVKSKSMIDNIDVYASGLLKKGTKAKGKMKAKVSGGEAVMYNSTGWRLDKFKGVNPVDPPETNSVVAVQ